jgi:CubicO group peptidase (beta-lactamase class C family)
MNRLQFRLLYREFLLRIIDLELIAPQGDMSKLLGQFAALLIIVSLWLSPVVGGLAASQPEGFTGVILSWVIAHFLISTTMLVVGLFGVLSWNALFPDRRDILVLSPLPVPARTVFLAKVAAVATALALSIAALNLFTGLVAPFGFATAPKATSATYDPALPPLAAGAMKDQLDRDLHWALGPDGPLATRANPGVVIAVSKHGETQVFAYGKAHPDSIFEIGSISKTFTALLLARKVVEKQVRLDEPVRELLPIEIHAARSDITLLDLATHHSGLPGMPDNLATNDYPNPAANYRAGDLYRYIAKRGLSKPADPGFHYSNLGFGLLGTALAAKSGTSYSDLLGRDVTGPLVLPDTELHLDAAQTDRAVLSYGPRGKPGHMWDLDALAPAGAIRSTAPDLIRYLEFHLHPENAPNELREALRLMQQVHAESAFGKSITLAWIFDPRTSTYWHNGAIGGYTSYAFFNPRGDYAGAVLYNGATPAGFTDLLGEHLDQRLSGRPAVSVVDRIVARSGGSAPILRAFVAYWLVSALSGIFMLGFLVTFQGLAQLLPRQAYLRISSALQLCVFAAIVIAYFFQAPFNGPDILLENHSLVEWLPTYWFFGVFEWLNGTLPNELALLASRGVVGLALACAGAAASYLICYFLALKKIAEQPDILPDSRRIHWLPPFGDALQTALGHFAVRTLLRSRQHRVILSFYLGIALGLAVYLSRSPVLREGSALLLSSTLMLVAAIVGARIVFAIPLDIRANWIFRVLPLPGVPGCLTAARRAIYFLAVFPVLSFFAIALALTWPWRQAAEHLAILALIAFAVTEICMYRFTKIPFTCSYQPGKSYVHLVIIGVAGLMILARNGARFEQAALYDQKLYAAVVAIVLSAGLISRWLTARAASSEEATLRFEDPPEPAVMSLDL